MKSSFRPRKRTRLSTDQQLQKQQRQHCSRVFTSTSQAVSHTLKSSASRLCIQSGTRKNRTRNYTIMVIGGVGKEGPCRVAAVCGARGVPSRFRFVRFGVGRNTRKPVSRLFSRCGLLCVRHARRCISEPPEPRVPVSRFPRAGRPRSLACSPLFRLLAGKARCSSRRVCTPSFWLDSGDRNCELLKVVDR